MTLEIIEVNFSNMKQIILLTTILLFSCKSNQSTSKNSEKEIEVHYAFKLQPKEKTERNDEVKKSVDEIVTQFKNLDFVLNCSKSKSSFELIENLKLKDSFAYKAAAISVSKNYRKYYADNDLKLKGYRDGEGKHVKLEHGKPDWKITTESKMVNNYKCYKATAIDSALNYKTNKYMIENITAWFAPEVPYNFGPMGWDGLPGLVIEATKSDKNYFIAEKIIFKN